MVLQLDANDRDFRDQFSAFLNNKRESDHDVRDTVAAIIKDIRQNGDAGLVRLTEKFDRHSVTEDNLAISAADMDAAIDQVDPKVIHALEMAAARIKAFHQRQLPEDMDYIDDHGIRLGQRWTPVDAVGLYVPGGLANYPSSVLMNAIPAKVAGVNRLVMTVPTPEGVISPVVLAAARIAGVTEIYRVGGAQAIAALAYGTKAIKPVATIVGPGNAYVAEAKRQVFGTVGIDTIAGPSEILIIADGANKPEWIAADLLSQAEHDAVAQSILITDDKAFGDRVMCAVQEHLKRLPKADIARASWNNYGAVITVSDLDQAARLADMIAAEHLELCVADPDALMLQIKHAGAIFLGRLTPEALGDYVAGPNHVLPTARRARFAGGLSVFTFIKRTTFVGTSAAGLAKIGPTAITLAESENLDAHALSVAIRLNDPDMKDYDL